jgi:hypothetical protein
MHRDLRHSLRVAVPVVSVPVSWSAWSQLPARPGAAAGADPVPGRLGDAPAVVVFQLHQRPLHHLSGGLAGFPATETPRYLPKQIFQQDTRLVIR